MRRRVELAVEDTRCRYRSRYLLMLALAIVMAFGMDAAPASAAQASEQRVDSQIVGALK